MSIQFQSILKAVNNYNVLQRTNQSLLEQLSTGKKINSTADNPALFARISNFQREIAQTDIYLQNINEGSTVLSLASDGISKQLDTLGKMLELAGNAQDSGISQNTRNAYQEQFLKLYEELNSIANNTTFNSKKLLDGSFAEEGLTITTGKNQTFEITMANTTTGEEGLDLEGISISSKTNAETAYTAIEAAMEKLTSMQGGLGTDEFILTSRAGIMESKQSELESLIEQYQEVDLTKTAAQLNQNQIIQQYALSGISSLLETQQHMAQYLFPAK